MQTKYELQLTFHQNKIVSIRQWYSIFTGLKGLNIGHVKILDLETYTLPKEKQIKAMSQQRNYHNRPTLQETLKNHLLAEGK